LPSLSWLKQPKLIFFSYLIFSFEELSPVWIKSNSPYFSFIVFKLHTQKTKSATINLLNLPSIFLFFYIFPYLAHSNDATLILFVFADKIPIWFQCLSNPPNFPTAFSYAPSASWKIASFSIYLFFKCIFLWKLCLDDLNFASLVLSPEVSNLLSYLD